MILVFKFFHIDHEMLKMFWILRRLWLLCSSIHLLLFSWRMLRIVSVITHSTNTRWLHNIKQARNYFIDKKKFWENYSETYNHIWWNSEIKYWHFLCIFAGIINLKLCKDHHTLKQILKIASSFVANHCLSDGEAWWQARLGLRLWQPVTRGQQHHCPVQCHSYLGGGRGWPLPGHRLLRGR